MRGYLILQVIIAFTLTISGCVTDCFNAPDTRHVLFADDYDYYANDSSSFMPSGIIGAWSSNGLKVALVDPGLISDS